MANELWVSAKSGYRRKGTSLSDLTDLFTLGITAAAILEPLQTYAAQEPSSEARESLEERGFDIAGVESVDSGVVIGFIDCADLGEGRVEDHAQPILAQQLIADTAPLRSVLLALKSSPSKFVLSGHRVNGIVTRADLNKPPVRMYLFGVISLLEMHLTFWIKNVYSEERVSTVLSKRRREKAKLQQAELRRRREDPLLIDCLQFCDKRKLVLGDGTLREALGLRSRTSATRNLRSLEDLRDSLAHSRTDLASGSSWEQRIDLIDWAEALVGRSEELIEKPVRQDGQSDNEGSRQSEVG